MSDILDIEDIRREYNDLRARRNAWSEIHEFVKNRVTTLTTETDQKFTTLMNHERSRCFAVIRSGKHPIYCTLGRHHEGEHWGHEDSLPHHYL